MDEAIAIVSKVCAYTNHTILAGALEKWPIAFLEKSSSAVNADHPRNLDNRIRATVKDRTTYIIQNGLCAYGSHGHPLRLQRQRRCLPAHRDFKEYRAEQLL